MHQSKRKASDVLCAPRLPSSYADPGAGGSTSSRTLRASRDGYQNPSASNDRATWRVDSLSVVAELARLSL